MLAVALMSAVCAGVAYADKYTVTSTVTDVLVSDGTVPAKPYPVIAKDGSEILSVTGTVQKYATLFVREGTMQVGDGSTATKLTVSPDNGRAGSLNIGGKNAKVVLNNGKFVNGGGGFRTVGNGDGCGVLELTNGSKMVDGDCEVFRIGTPSYTSSTGYTGGDFVEAKNGSGVMFGRGDVLVNGGSQLQTNYGSFFMGEGSLTAEGETGKVSTVTIGYKNAAADSHLGLAAVLGYEENSTSEIHVKSNAIVSIYTRTTVKDDGTVGGRFYTSYSDNSSTFITVEGENAELVLDDSGKKKSAACIGVAGANTITDIQIANGGKAKLNTNEIWIGEDDSNNVVNIEIDKDSTLEADCNFMLMDEGTTISNSGTMKVKTSTSESFYIYGGNLINTESGKITAVDIYAYDTTGSTAERYIGNAGTIETQYGLYVRNAKVDNTGLLKVTSADASVMVRAGAEFTNKGIIDGAVSLNGEDAVFTATDGSQMGKTTATLGTLVIDGAVTMTGDLECKSSNVQLAFTETGSLDMGGNSLTLGAAQVILQVDGHVGQMTSVDNKEFFTNYSSSDFSDDMEVVVVGSDGSTSIRKAGDLNYGTFLTGSGNQKSVYNAIEKMVADGVASDALVAISELKDSAALEAALDALSGHEYATAMSSQMDGNMGHLRRLRESMGKGAALSLEGIAPQGDGKGGMTTRLPLVGGISVYHEESKLEADTHGDGYDRTENGAMVNVECQVKENVTLGGAITYGRTKLHSANAMNRYEDNTRLDAYALYGGKAWNFATSFGLGMHEHELKRALGRDDVDGYSINFMQEAAYTVYGDEDSSVQLVGTLESSWNKLDNISDGQLRSNDLSAWSTDVSAGVRYNCALRAWGNAPAGMFSAQAGVRASVGDINPSIELGMGDYTWRQDCAKSNRWGWSMSAGVDVPVRTDVSVFGAAETVLRGDYNSAGGQIGVRVAF